MLADVVRGPMFKTVFNIVVGVGLIVLVFHRDCKGDACTHFKAPSLKEMEDGIYKVDSKCYKFADKQIPCPAEGTVVEPFRDEFSRR
jgi:hypothetical protein